MPWLIQHKCNLSQSGVSNYAVMRGERNGQLLTRVICPKSDCREEFYVIGHELFGEAEAHDQTKGFPPGFVIPHGRTIS